MAVLVTGGAGFIGSHVTERLLEHQERIVVLDNFNNFYSSAQKHQNIKGFSSNPRVKIIRGDIRSTRVIQNVLSKHHVSQIVHLAALPGVRSSIEYPKRYFDVNVRGTLNLLEASRLQKISKIIFASTSSVYGNTAFFPTKETDSTEVQLSPYAASKRMGEVLSNSYFLSFGLPITCLRFFTAYGPRNRPDLAMYKFSKAIHSGKPLTVFGDGNSQRDYTFVKDIADSVVCALDADLEFETLNIGSNRPTKLVELIKVLENAFEKKAVIEKKPWPSTDIPVTFADISKARRLLGWKPKTSLKNGVAQLAEWYLSVQNRE